MRQRFLKTLLLMLTATPTLADYIGPDGKVRDCYCTDTTGARVDLGEKICLFVDGRAFMAQCDMSLNVPIWRDTGEECLSSDLKRPKPLINTVTVYPKI